VQEPFDAEAYLEATTFGVAGEFGRGSRHKYIAFQQGYVAFGSCTSHFVFCSRSRSRSRERECSYRARDRSWDRDGDREREREKDSLQGKYYRRHR
jgi:hypothetical protein